MKDQLGVVCSGLCVIHCLASPILLSLGLSGVFASLFTQELFHFVIIFPVVLLMLWTLPKAYQRDKSLPLVTLALAGVSVLVSALFVEKYEVMLSVIGGASVITYHILNLHSQRKAQRNPEDEHVIFIK
jgi:Zn-dependent protease with chaperone function